MRIYLVGYMGAGKSTTAKRLARQLGVESFDTDRMFEERFHIAINDFFRKYDETLYRKLESDILHATETFDNAVISTGGGTACFNENMRWMNQHGFTVFLKLSTKSLFDRLSQSKVRRPLVWNRPPEELMAYIEKNYDERLPFYEQAQLTVKGEDCDIQALAAEIQKQSNEALS